MRSVPSEKLKMVEGCQIEMSYNKNDGLWYEAIIEAQSPINPKARRSELCVRLLMDDFSTSISKLNQNPKVSFRPVPPKNVEAQIDVKQGSIVDVVRKYIWRTGTLVKEIEDDKCLVFFDSPPDIFQFERKLVRPHLEWVDEKWWVIPGRNAKFLRQLNLEPVFFPGAMVEVRFQINKEVIWLPGMVITDIEEDGEKKFSVKNSTKTINLNSVWPLMKFKRSDLRPLMKLQDDGAWKQSRKTTSTQGSGNEMRKPVMNAKESDPPESASPDRAATPLKQTETETQRNQNGLTNDSVPENENNRENDRKRKREEELQNLSSVATVEVTEANDTAMVLPFEKKSTIWKKVESMEIFKTFPQSPHFSPLVGTSEDSREVSAVGMMFTFSGLLEEVKDLQPDHPRSSLFSLDASFVELEKHGFDVRVPQLRISKLLSLIDMQTKKLEELKDAEKVTAEKERVKVEAEKEIAQSKSCEATIVQQLEDVKFQFQTITSTPW